jgi:hypothetical protein
VINRDEALLDLNGTFVQDPEIEAWWATRPAPLGAIAREWWLVMRAAGPDVRESLHNGYPSACLELYPFAYVDAFTAHVNVGFYYGAFLPDPHRLLIGSGKRMRHVKLFPDKPVDAAALGALISAAHLDLQMRIARAG